MFMIHFITNYDRTHLSESMKNDARISIKCMGLWAFCDYAIGVDTHNAQFVDKSNFKKPCSTYWSYLGQYMPGFSNMQL